MISASSRQQLEREISTLLQKLDSLETDAAEAGHAQKLAPELARVDTALTAAGRALRTLAPAAAASRPPGRRTAHKPVQGRRKRQDLRNPAHGRAPSTNAYLPEPLSALGGADQS